MSLSSFVSIVKVKDSKNEEEVTRGVRAALELIGGLKPIITPGSKVFIKPNLVAVPHYPGQGTVTNPLVVKALAELVGEAQGLPVIGDSAAVGVDTEAVIHVEGYDALRKRGYQVIDLKRTPEVDVQNSTGKVLRKIPTYATVMDSQVIISVPVMKTHDQLSVTLSLKNLKGLLRDSGKRYLHFRGVVDGVVDLAEALKPRLAVIDGTVAQEGLGPTEGRPVNLGVIVASQDLVAADAVAGAIMGYEPSEVPITWRAAERGLGNADLSSIRVLGLQISQVARRFERPEEAAYKLLGGKGIEILIAPTTCTGCRCTLISTLVDLVGEKSLGAPVGELDGSAAGKLQAADRLSTVFVAGRLEPSQADLISKLHKNVILIGNCSRKWQAMGRFVPGCPPRNEAVQSALCQFKSGS